MDIKIVSDNITVNELKEVAKEFYTLMVKGVVDIEEKIIAFGGEYHMDANKILIENGSKQENIWGFNVYFNKSREEWIEYTSLINIRPLVNNNDMEVQDKNIRDKMKQIINSKII